MSGEMASWEIKLARVVVPIRSEPLRTLSEARAYILALPPGTRHQDEWERAADLLMAAVDLAQRDRYRAGHVSARTSTIVP